MSSRPFVSKARYHATVFGADFYHEYQEPSVWHVLAEMAEIFNTVDVCAKVHSDGSMTGHLNSFQFAVRPAEALRRAS